MFLRKYDNGFGIFGYLKEEEIPDEERELYIEVSDDTFDDLRNRKVMWQNGELVDNPDYESYKAEREVRIAKNKQLNILRQELREIQKWFKDNDWKPNKIVAGEWQQDDPRWTDYINERSIKRTRQDELNQELENLK